MVSVAIGLEAAIRRHRVVSAYRTLTVPTARSSEWLLTRMLQHNSRCRWGGKPHHSCEPPRPVGLSLHDPHHLGVLNRHFVALCILARRISPLECPVPRYLHVLNFHVVT